MAVAIKTCKVESEHSMGEKFLEEACKCRDKFVSVGRRFSDHLLDSVSMLLFQI